MDYRRKFAVAPGAKAPLAGIDPSDALGEDAKKAAEAIEANTARMAELQYLLYADASQSLLVILQALDAGGKDGVVRHLFRGMNPQGTKVASFKTPTPEEAAHDFLWRGHRVTPANGEVAVFNRSYYENVLIVRVRNLVPRAVWSRYYDVINDFERALALNRTRILKFYLHISPEEQLARFKARLDDKTRQWKISEADYAERALWPQYIEAYEEALMRTSTERAPWHIIPANHKWFRNLAISEIVVATMEEMGLSLPAPRVDLAEIRRKYHAAATESRSGAAGKAGAKT